MVLAKWRNRALISLAAGYMVSEILYVSSNYNFRISGFGLGIFFYLAITLAFSVYLRYKMHKEIYKESDDELLDNLED
jgi:hypothetical protein